VNEKAKTSMTQNPKYMFSEPRRNLNNLGRRQNATVANEENIPFLSAVEIKSKQTMQSFKKEAPELLNPDKIKIRVQSKSGTRTSTNTRASQGGNLIVSGQNNVRNFKQRKSTRMNVSGQTQEPTYNNRVAKAHAELQQFFAKFDSDSA
jgi:hypothetical protein